MKLFLFTFNIFFIFLQHPTFAVFNKNEETITKPPLQVEELPWLSFFELNKKTESGGENSGRKEKNYFERKNARLTSISTLCPPGETGYFHYPPDCKKFINCWKGRGSIQVCAPGTLFNPETSECDFPGKVKCAGENGDFGKQIPMPTKERYVQFPNVRPPILHNPRIARNQVEETKMSLKKSLSPQTNDKEEVRPQCSIGATGLYPHPYDCSKFLKCWSGNTFIQNCGPGTFFNPLISACDHPRNVPCAHGFKENFIPGDSIPIPAIPEDVLIQEASVNYEQYQDLNQIKNTEMAKENKKTDIPTGDPASPSYLDEVVHPPTTSFSDSSKEIANKNSLEVVQQNSNNRKPKIINTGKIKQQQIQNTFGNEPAQYLTPPKYDVYGNLIKSSGSRLVLGVQPTYSEYPHVSGQKITDSEHKHSQVYRPTGLYTSSYPFLMSYPPQGPYSMKNVMKGLSQDKTKNYNGFILNQKHSLQSNHGSFPHDSAYSQSQVPPLYQPNSGYSQHLYTFLPSSPNQQSFMSYAPHNPSISESTSFNMPAAGFHKIQMNPYPQYPSNPCLMNQKYNGHECSPSVFSHQSENPSAVQCSEPNQNKPFPSAPECEPKDNYSALENKKKTDRPATYYPVVYNGYPQKPQDFHYQNSDKFVLVRYPQTPSYYAQANVNSPQPHSVLSGINSFSNEYNQQRPTSGQTPIQFFHSSFDSGSDHIRIPSQYLTPPSMESQFSQSNYYSPNSKQNSEAKNPENSFSQSENPQHFRPNSNIPAFSYGYQLPQTSKTDFLPSEIKSQISVPILLSTTEKSSEQIPQSQVNDLIPFTSTKEATNTYIDLYPKYPKNSEKTEANFQERPLQSLMPVSPKPEKTATFPPFPGNTVPPKATNSIKTGTKNSPKPEPVSELKSPEDYILDKIDLRTMTDQEDVENISIFSAAKDTQKIEKNPIQSVNTDNNKSFQLEKWDEVEETTKKILKPEVDLTDEEKIQKPKKLIKKPFVKVKSTPPNGQIVRLRNGASHLDGYLEMKDAKSKWGLVCDKPGNWQIEEATTACRELGFIRGAELSWQGYPIKSEADEVFVAVDGINCTGKEASLSECEVNHSDQQKCDVGRNAVGVRCFDNLASHCQPGEILYNQNCYKLYGKENPDDPGLRTEEASDVCKKYGGKLVDITSQYENDFISEWLVKKHPEVTSVATGGIGISVLGRPMWLWEGTSDPMVYERWWSGWSGEQNVPKGSINGPLCIILKKTFSCSEADEDQKNVESSQNEETCSADYFFWDVEDCNKLRTSVFICERPMDDIGCVVGNGEGYVGTANTTASGRPCLPWDHPKVVEGLARRGHRQKRSDRLTGHNYCRNLGKPDRHPWCFVEGRENSEYCAIPRCWDSVSGYSRSSGSWTSCDQYHFECKPGECIKKQWVCDGQKDCTNGKDEETCKVFIQEFSKMRNKKMKSKGIEKWPHVNENVCAKLCLQNKNFKCRSFSYNLKDRDCHLNNYNIGMSGQVVNAKGWLYYELSSESLNCTLENNFFGCQNGKCINISNVCDGKDNCGDGSDEKDCGRLGYEIRLSGSNEKHMGRVEVKVLGRWGVVCDDMFDLRDANVVCREVGFPLGAADVVKHSHFPVNNPLFLVDHLECWGNETTIRECSFPGWGKHNCGPDEVVGVVCRVSGLECPEEQWQCKSSKECILTAYLCDGLVDCDDKSDENKTMCESPTQIRLAGGPNATAGRLEIKHFNTWGTVCHDDFSVDAANAVCRILGFNGPSVVKKNAYFGPGKGPIWLDNGQCLDNETDLEECKKHLGKQNNCKHEEDVSLICSLQMDQKSSPHKPIITSSVVNVNTNSEEKMKQVLISECSGKPRAKIKKNEEKYEKVVGGTMVTREALPWQASVRVKSGSRKSVHWCGAIIITSYHILTAGHCLRDYKKAAYFIRVGDYDTEVPDPHEVEFEIEHLYIHPNFSKEINLNNDIGLVKIKGEIIFGEDIRPACLVPSLHIYQPGINCSVSGWGSVSPKSAGFARTLRKAYVPILEQSICRAPFVYGDSLSEGMFCAGQLDGGVDSCQGDSGGPLMCQYEEREYLFGITSWGHGCGRANKPGVYTNVAYYTEWIQQKIKASLN